MGFGSSPAAILGLSTLSTKASRLFSFFPCHTGIFQLLLLQFTFCCTGPVGRKSSFIPSVQDSTRQAAHSGNDGKELPDSSVQPCLSSTHCYHWHAHTAHTSPATGSSHSVQDFYWWTGCTSYLWHSVLYLAFHSSQESTPISHDPCNPPWEHGSILLGYSAAQHPRNAVSGTLEQPELGSFEVPSNDYVVCYSFQCLYVCGGPHRLWPAVVLESSGAVWSSRWNTSSWHAPPEAQQQLRSFLQSLGQDLWHCCFFKEKDSEKLTHQMNTL